MITLVKTDVGKLTLRVALRCFKMSYYRTRSQFVYLAMTWNWLRRASNYIPVYIMTATSTDKHTAPFVKTA